MTILVTMNSSWICVYQRQSLKPTILLTKHAVPWSFEEFKLWYDMQNFKRHRIMFNDINTHRQLCLLTCSKFEKLDFPQYEYICKLLRGEREDA